MFRDRLATSMDGMIAAKNLLFPPPTFELGKQFRPRPSDVIITPWSKSGTTWLQQIAHGLRSGGDMTFDDISRVSPWLEVANALGIDLDADQGWEPRLYKSHYSFHAVPKGCRYLVSFREPHAVMVSYYRFYEGWLFEPGTVTLDEYLAPHLDLDSPKNYWTHLDSWWEKRHDDDTLLLSYETMLEDHRPAVEAVARFLGIDADDELLDLVTRQSSRHFMLEHVDKFNDTMHRERGGEVGAHPVGVGSTKVTDGSFDSERYRLSDAAIATMAKNWAATMDANWGIASYAELVELMRGRS